MASFQEFGGGGYSFLPPLQGNPTDDAVTASYRPLKVVCYCCTPSLTSQRSGCPTHYLQCIARQVTIRLCHAALSMVVLQLFPDDNTKNSMMGLLSSIGRCREKEISTLSIRIRKHCSVQTISNLPLEVLDIMEVLLLSRTATVSRC